MKNIPDYSSDTKRLNMFAYIAPLGKNVLTINGIQQETPDFRTKERYQEYKDCGFDILLLDSDNAYWGDEKNEDFNTSLLKKQLDWAEEIGLKVLIYDARIYILSKVEGTLIGRKFEAEKDGEILSKNYFSSFDELVEYVKHCLKDYRKHPAFLGYTLFDEPTYARLDATGEVYRAIKAADKTVEVQSELACYLWSTPKSYFTGEGEFGATLKDYDVYLKKFLE